MKEKSREYYCELPNWETTLKFLRHRIGEKKMGIIEKLGSGIKLIFDSCHASKIVPPTFSENGDYVKVIFEFRIIKNEKKADEEILIDLFKVKSVLNINEMIDHLGRSKNTTFKVLHYLINQGLVKRIGKGKNTRYILS